MAWWAWVVLGTVLLAIELTLVDAQFYLLFVGAAALVVGIFGIVGIDMPTWAQWMAFGVLSLVALAVFRRKIYDLTRVHGERMTVGPAGEEVTIPIDLAPGDTCRVEYRGSTWSAQNTGGVPIAGASRARIINVDGLTLHVRAVGH